MPRRWLPFVLLLGVYLTLRGYHSRDGDQAYRLPLLLRAQNPSAYRDDPFVRAFDEFNPHRGYLTLLDAAGRPFGLSVGLFALYLAAFGATAFGVDRLARLCFPAGGAAVGLAAVGLILAARAGNVGTNHLFDGVLLDRLLALGLGWSALALAVESPTRAGRPALLIGLAALVHPSMGLQLGMALTASLVVWGWREGGIRDVRSLLGPGLVALCLLPSVRLMSGQGGRLFEGLPADAFRTLSAEIQSPQHMLPGLWRKPQWLAWFAYLALIVPWRPCRDEAGVDARRRLLTTLGLVAVGLGFAAVGIELLRDVRLTVFQPFRMATLARGLALIATSGRVWGLWRDGGLFGRLRAGLIVSGLAGDWAFVVAVAAETVASAAEAASFRRRWTEVAHALAVGAGLVFLNRHDTERGHWALLAGAAAVLIATAYERWMRPAWNRRRIVLAVAATWCVPTAAFVVPPIVGLESGNRLAEALARRCRFWPVPIDDVERLAVWTRDHTPAEARFVGPPGPKGFRLFSERSLAFNRAGSPYHARGLADWAGRFKDHVGFEGSDAAFAASYLANRQMLEAGFARKGEPELVELARRQGADHVLAASDLKLTGRLELLKAEGRYAVYRVAPPELAGDDSRREAARR